MELLVQKREKTGKGISKRVRREGGIPAVLYSKGGEGESIIVDRASYEAALRQTKPGHLPTITFTLKGDGADRKAVVKEVQYHPTTYAVLHLDLEELHDDVPVRVNVPITLVGAAECAGVKEGGVIRQVIRHMRVSCLPKDMPKHLELDVRSLKLKESARLAAIAVPETVRPLARMGEVAAVVAKR